ncbi:MAG: fimbria/pilus outer membrane usher protein [Luteibacter sp.]
MGTRRRRAGAILLASGVILFHGTRVHAQDGKAVDFDASFLPGGTPMSLDLTRFRRGNAVLPGLYEVDVWLNENWQGRRPVRFVERQSGSDATPCLSREDLEGFGLKAYPVAGTEDACEPIGVRVAGAVARLDVGEQRLDIDVPQAMLLRRHRDVAPRDQWSEGVVAGLLDWRLNLQGSSSRGRQARSMYLGNEAGFNGAGWRLRHAGAFSGRRYRSERTYVQHAIAPLAASLRAGEVSSGGELFEPVALRGVELSSDPRMNAGGAPGYVPTVSGTVEGRARIRITQGDALLREITVPAGPYVVDDLQASGRGGDVVVDVEEDNGRRQRYRVPFFAMPELLREGEHRFALSAGSSRRRGVDAGPIVQGSWRQGMPHGLTLYGGTRWMRAGRWVMAGAALDTLMGGFSIDGMRVSRGRGGRTAPTWRGRYGTRWHDGSLLSVSFTQGMHRRSGPARAIDEPSGRHRRIDLLFQRTLASGSGAMGIGMSYASYARGGTELDHMLTWNRMWRSLSFDVSLRQVRRRGPRHGARPGAREGRLAVSVPFGRLARSPTAGLAWRTADGAAESQASLTGASGDDRAWAYAISAAKNRATGARLDTAVSRAFAGGDVGLGLSRSRQASSASLSAAGGMVIHAGGVTFAPHLGESMALLRARHARGARLASSAVGRVDRRGYAIVPNLVPFRWNSVEVDPTGLPLDVTFAATHRRIVPTAGAIVLVPFDTQRHPTVLLSGRMGDGAPLPFGAEIVDGEGRSMGFVGQGGRALVRWEGDPSPITLRWSGEQAGRCLLQVISVRSVAGLNHHEGICR